MRAALMLSCLCAGCFDYAGLSAGLSDGASSLDGRDALADVNPGPDLGSEDMALITTYNDMAGADLVGADLAGVDMVPFYPVTCASVKAAIPGSGDGSYTLFVGAASAKSWTAYCKDMATSPKEYLTLPAGNYSQYSTGGYASGPTVKTTYQRVRVDPVSLKVDTSDQTYATSTGMITQGASTTTSMPYAVAMDCYGTMTTTGRANLDLRGTSFSVAVGAFTVDGNAQAGTTTYSSSNQVVVVTGGGACGWCAAGVYTGNGPVNGAGGYFLQLVR